MTKNEKKLRSQVKKLSDILYTLENIDPLLRTDTDFSEGLTKAQKNSYYRVIDSVMDAGEELEELVNDIWGYE